ncbi:fibronectin type III domain-containing protein [Fervidobacterium thailandense]|uniref:Fibronectin type-III domain-containing protein n=1 Tax=Fervidobacterium thailandense TaxID=1008305 RepID=A0A1E3G485_9BACT|nr:fibronectin type III domain-containing protein [Fervidobacterium thailandense]ODN31049.1 hypothetical protein A4H02_01895 [Fervidobacterium thailandense]
MKRFALLAILLLFFGILTAQVQMTTPLTKLYYELKALLEDPTVNLAEALQDILKKYAPIVEPVLPPGEYEEYSLRLSELDRSLLEMGIWITRATVEIFNQQFVEGPFELNYNRETGEATGLITKLKSGRYNVIVKVFGKIDNKEERIVAYGRRDNVEVVRDRISLAQVPLNILVGTGAILINALLDFQNSEFVPGELTNFEPEDGAVDVPTKVSLKWDSLRAKSFDIYFGEEGNLDLIQKNHFEKEYTLEGLKPGTVYNWKIVARNAFGETESPILTFRTGFTPTQPSDPVPYDGAERVWVEPILLWSSERAAEFDVYMGTSPENLNYLGTVLEPSFEAPKLELGTTYYWKVVAKNAFGETEGPVWKFTTGDVPSKPVLIEPKGEKVWIQPAFKWKSKDASEFELYLGTSFDEMELAATTTELEITLPFDLELGTTYFWKVVAKNDFGHSESDVEMFKTGTKPEFIEIISPLDGEEDVWKSQTLAWRFEYADAYDVYMGPSVDELEPIATDITDSELVVENLELGKTYYWQVVGKNKFGETPSPVVKFTVGNVPTVPFNPEPPDGATDQFTNLVLRWESSKAESYDLYMGFVPDKLELVYEDLKESAVEMYDLLFGVKYYWKVVAKNRFGEAEGPVWSFTTGMLPEKPVAIYPKDGDTEVPADVVLKWRSERAEEFDLYFGRTEPEFVDTLRDTEYALPRLHFGTEYKWKVTARNKFGEVESDIFTFRVKLPTIVDSEVYGGKMADTVKRVVKTTDGGYIVVGSTQSSELPGFMGESDIIVLKLDKSFKLEWMRLLGGSGWDEGMDVVEVPDGYVVLGYTQSPKVDGQDGKGGWDAVAFKLAKDGKQLWTTLYGGTGHDIPYRVIYTKGGELLVVGTSNSVNGDVGRNIGTWDVWVSKLSYDGKLLASAVYGGLDRDKAVDVVEVEDGFIIVGATYSLEGDVPYNHGSSDIWMLKISKDLGKVLMLNKAYGGTEQDEATRIIKTSDGNFLILGYTTSTDGDVQRNNGFWDIWAVKVNAAGEIIWQRTIGGKEEDVGYSVAEFPDGGFVIVGYTLSREFEGLKGAVDVLIIDIDKDGNLRWAKTYGGALADYAYDVLVDEDGSIVVVGVSFSKNFDVKRNLGGSDIWIFRVK